MCQSHILRLFMNKDSRLCDTKLLGEETHIGSGAPDINSVSHPVLCNNLPLIQHTCLFFFNFIPCDNIIHSFIQCHNPSENQKVSCGIILIVLIASLSIREYAVCHLA